MMLKNSFLHRMSLARFREEGRFAAVMGGGAVISLLRGFAAAGILLPAEFGLYALVIAVGGFSSTALGFGRIESSRKMFPRLFVDGHMSQILGLTDGLSRSLALRATAATILMIGCAGALGEYEWAVPICLAGAVAISVGWSLVLTSAQRAGPDLTHLANASFLRALLASVLGVGGGYAFGWVGFVVGEIIATTVINIFARELLRRSTRAPLSGTNPPLRGQGSAWAVHDRTGLMLFIAFTGISIPIYLGRAYVAAVFSDFELGQFSFLMLLVMAAATAAAIIDQKIGPEMVRMERSGASYPIQLRYLVRSIAISATLIALSLSFASLLLFLPTLDYFVERFSLTPTLFIPIIVFGALQVTTICDWMLQSRNRERQILLCMVLYVGTLSVGSVVVAIGDLPLLWFLWAMAIAKAGHIIAQLLIIFRNGRDRSSSLREDVY